MSHRGRSPQPDLLDWEPPEPTVRFADQRVRAATLGARIAKAISASMSDRKLTREKIAAEMAAYLGQDVRPSSLNAYASESRDDVINVVRFMALVAVTGDRRLLELLAAEMGWAVVERRHLRLIELAALQDKQESIRERASALRRAARAEGSL